MRLAIAAILGTSLLLGVATEAGAACGCSRTDGTAGTIGSDASGPCLTHATSSTWDGAAPRGEVTWRFSQAGTCFAFADGSWGVLPDVGRVTAIEPDATGSGGSLRNGYQLNPTSDDLQSLDGRSFKVKPLPFSLPYAPQAGQSIVKAHSLGTQTGSGGNTQYLRFVSVLTVLGQAPSQLVFRPPMTHSAKPLFAESRLDLSLLPKLPVPSSAPTASGAKRLVANTYYSWPPDWWANRLQPREAAPAYFPTMDGQARAQAFLYTTLNVPDTAKRPVVRGLVQQGIDLWGALQGGVRWSADAGIRNGRYLPIVYAAELLDSSTIRGTLSSAASSDSAFSEWNHVYYSSKAGTVLYGRDTVSGDLEERYWDCVGSTGRGCSSKDARDPYGMIDGGKEPGGSYMEVTWGPYKYTSLMYWLVPELRGSWNADELVRYVDRLMREGVRASPDSCAAPGSASGYGSAWGPNGSGGCISGSGRFPALDGRAMPAGGAARTNDLGEEMWSRYRSCADSCGCSGMSGLCGGDGSTSEPLPAPTLLDS